MENAENKEYTIDDFRKEIEGTSKNPENAGDFPEEINPAELTENDMAIWGKIRDESIEMTDIIKYRQSFEKEKGFESATRYNFLMFMFNKATVIIGKRELRR